MGDLEGLSAGDGRFEPGGLGDAVETTLPVISGDATDEFVVAGD